MRGDESLPRTRGDRPTPRSPFSAKNGSPPHPRGSTRQFCRAETELLVSPAPAGIDLAEIIGLEAVLSLPRTRGDRPLIHEMELVASLSPPHPRGSTRVRDTWKRWKRVSPAPAGIDPRRWDDQVWQESLPRTRGDRPHLSSCKRSARLSPPHPRGSTHTAQPIFSEKRVSPAPAGIDPTLLIAATLTIRLPRTRGDRPWGCLIQKLKKASPPHPRGSTRTFDIVHVKGIVSPAPAGIDLDIERIVIPAECLPRTRGDRPAAEWTQKRRQRSPPHPRGSTLYQQRVMMTQQVSPAPAGIDLDCITIAHTERGLPRTRGDRPAIETVEGEITPSPPHPRGSTRRALPPQAHQHVSPAPAGIDPLASFLLFSTRSLPRTRGDRPQ